MNETKKSVLSRILLGVAAILFTLYAIPNMVYAQQANPNPTGNVPEEVELPVDISIDVLTDGDNNPPSTEVTINMINSKSGKEIDLTLPQTGKPEDVGSTGAGAPFDTPPVEGPPFDTPPVIAPPVETPPVDAPPFDTPPVDIATPVELIPPVEAPPIEVPVVTPPVDGPPFDAPPVGTPPVDTP